MTDLKYMLIFPLIFIILNGCSFSKMMREARKYNAIGGKYLVHKNPKSGDYASYKMYGLIRWRGTVDADISFEGSKVIQITKIENGKIYITENEIIRNVKVLKMKAGLMRPSVRVIPLLRRIVTDMDGNILIAYSNLRLGYVLTKVDIAKPGDNNFVVWSSVNKAVDMRLYTGRKVETQPVWSKKKKKMESGALHFSQKADFNIFKINYVNPDIKFQTVMSTERILGKTSASLAWDEFVTNMVSMLSYTKLFSEPKKLIQKFIREKLTDFLLSSADEDKKEQVQEDISNSGLTSTFSMSMTSSIGYYLVSQGNVKKPLIRYRIREPQGFKRIH